MVDPSITKNVTVIIPNKLNKDGKWEVTIKYAGGLINVKTFPACASRNDMITYISKEYGNCTYIVV